MEKISSKIVLEATKNRAQVVALPNFITIRVFFTGGNTPLLAVISGLAVFRGRTDGVLFPLQVRDKYKWFHEHTQRDQLNNLSEPLCARPN